MITQSSISFVKESELIKRAASYGQLILEAEHRKHSSYPEFDSEIVGTFNLNKNFIDALQHRGFSFGSSIDPTRNRMFYLSGNSNQREKEVFESDCWAWERTKTDPQLNVYFRLLTAEDKRGIVCTPHVWGNCDGGACHIPTINNFIRVVAEHFPDAHPLIKEAANTNFQPVIFWGDINMAGIRSVGRLFREVYGQNEKITALAHSTLSPFNPSPYLQRSIYEVNDRAFVSESDQPRLFRQWKEQLENFKNSLY